ncbi:Zn(2)-C6 fungal-type DNA-binding domain protein [Cordyceps fumosorosea ARSEF 2679]|uniref:Zn(2)-C6 fungal-type DNA-binding domain protein n=1 Tax=Cordyceps fumosorosea (strain ARSEF 2679) TaxID=1081104 RepID=A0A162MY83_CORFA|nr:Zn(2)-C6 fungal-type DNA-binding domain protein [Cordyceps fumosorosea ARSEF 2679]OAA72549.1 Zn(2)-C6 fungal-type DNA-binding domain protein [Cordyceps fumosorosea ARSEF 2679]
MKTSRYSNTRQKSCQQCSDAKARCDRERARCARCVQRGLACAYPQVTSQSSDLSSGASIPSPPSDFSADTSAGQAKASQPVEDEADTHRSLDFTSLRLVCPIDAERIRNRWLNPYLEQPDQVVKAYPPMITRFISRMLGSYAAVAAHGRSAPPFIHPAQMHAPGAPLATCLSLVRVSDDPLLPGSVGNAALILQREMDAIAAQGQDEGGGFDDAATALDAFQAYLIYVLVLFFRLNQGSRPFFRNAMTTLQGLACVAAQTGLVCATDAAHARPRWEEWIVAEAKRRSLYVMYLLDSVLSGQENLPTYLGTELRGLPAPSSKTLWQAPTRAAWEQEYNIFLAEWSEPHLTIDELWPTPLEMDHVSAARRRSRVDRWLQALDEFGTMLFAVTDCTHGA